jgi:hypothetical protein
MRCDDGGVSSVFVREEDGGRTALAFLIGGLRDHPDRDTLGDGIHAQQAVTGDQRLFIQPLVLLVNLAPIAAAMPIQECGRRDGRYAGMAKNGRNRPAGQPGGSS